jgi:hypothetical protein
MRMSAAILFAATITFGASTADADISADGKWDCSYDSSLGRRVCQLRQCRTDV